ncbi:MAG: hypothetical protein ACPG8A_11395 [Psychrobium sp.]
MGSALFRTALIVLVLLASPKVFSFALSKQCIEAPKRKYACDNMIYTSIKRGESKTLVCVCKPDRKAIFSLLEKDNIATQRIEIRKLLAKHQMTKAQLIEILNQIN